MLTIGSLFSGIGGLELGLEWAGLGPVIWQVECDKYALKVLEKHWPEVERFTDVKEAGKHNLKQVDLICGGFPCQDLSVAGKRAGLENGKQSSLWFEMHRIIGELRPRYALIENVPGIYVSGLNRVLSDLAKIGYNAEWTHLSAKEVGAPHLRNRVFIIAYPECKCFDKSLEECGISIQGKKGKGHRKTYWDKFELVVGKMAPSKWRDEGCQINTRPLFVRKGNGVSNGVHRLKCLGNAVVPQVAQVIGEMIKEFETKMQIN